MKLKKSKPMQWVILVILLFIFAGIMVDTLHSSYESKLTLNTSQRQVQADASALLSSIQLVSNQSQNYKLGYHNFEKGNCSLAYKQLLPFARSADINATLVIGYMYEFGCGVTKDMKTASLWYYVGVQRNAYNKSPMLRGLHAYNSGDYAMAAEWFRMASELNVIKA
ncbi:SEL1-like repeat protein [Cysteiniphilum halobium]|uniref:hypothetical protein n=1 Tax=Cysteiniphilum halobium TaxID=2219059 RepID=UPI0013C2CD8B|nr:hypothetical protein [Cysteiniphilum halobium]